MYVYIYIYIYFNIYMYRVMHACMAQDNPVTVHQIPVPYGTCIYMLWHFNFHVKLPGNASVVTILYAILLNDSNHPLNFDRTFVIYDNTFVIYIIHSQICNLSYACFGQGCLVIQKHIDCVLCEINDKTRLKTNAKEKVAWRYLC